MEFENQNKENRDKETHFSVQRTAGGFQRGGGRDWWNRKRQLRGTCLDEHWEMCRTGESLYCTMKLLYVNYTSIKSVMPFIISQKFSA